MTTAVRERGLWERCEELARQFVPCWPARSQPDELDSTLQVLLEGVLAGVELRSSGLVDRAFAWAKVRLAAIGRDPGRLVRLARELVEPLIVELGEDQRACVTTLLRDVATFLRHVPDELPADPSPEMAEDRPGALLLQAMLAGDRLGARAVLTELEDVSRVLDERLEPAMRALGRLWQMGRLAPAQEHVASRLVVELMQDLSQRVVPAQAAPRVAFVRCRDDEHGFGQLCLQVHCRVAGLELLPLPPVEAPGEQVAMVVAMAPAAVAIGCTTARHLLAARAMLTAVRGTPALAGLPVLLGGGAFADLPQLAVQLGASAPAGSGRQTAHLLAGWLGTQPLYS